MSEHEKITKLKEGYKQDKGQMQSSYLNEVKQFIRALTKGELSWEKFLKALHYSSAAHLKALKNNNKNQEEEK